MDEDLQLADEVQAGAAAVQTASAAAGPRAGQFRQLEIGVRMSGIPSCARQDPST